ncbi:unnamed protein product [Pneumocystis jirovecii]|uniref:Uncharacterized protein n=1 Tax=Pneumocystis jirovecii TaxID=42068 RepID=L0PDZ6_PNEJI|nr:unnamed protein product [Pneumocystis jirovecii]
MVYIRGYMTGANGVDNKRRLFDTYGLSCAPPEREERGTEWFAAAQEQFMEHMFPQRTVRMFFREMSGFPRFSHHIPSSIFEEMGFSTMNGRYMDPFDFFDEMFTDTWFRCH